MRSILKRLLALSLLVLIVPHRAGALGLGEIKLNSYLNQPLNAKITLLPGSTQALDQVRVKLASPAAFEQAGIERLPVLDQIKFKVVKGKDGKPRIMLSSQDPIKEPFLDFILQVTWPNGRLSREYTVLLDPPTTTAEHAPPVAPAATTTAAGQQASQQTAGVTGTPKAGSTAQPTAPAAAPARPASRSIEAKLTHDSYGRTQRNDTLWSIAKAVRPDDSVSVQQVMLALVKKNPEAFYNDNVNTLKAGYVLRLPAKSVINQVDQVAAVRQVQREFRQWQQIKQGNLLAENTVKGAHGGAHGAKPAGGKASGVNRAASKPAAAGGKAAAEGARLTLLPATVGKAGAGGAVTSATGKSQASGGAEGGALQQQLRSFKADQEKQIDSLRSQVDALNQQVTSMQRLLSLKNNSLATLQRRAGNVQGAAAATQAAPKSQVAAPKPSPAPQAAAGPQAAKPAAPKAARPAPKPSPRKIAVPPPTHISRSGGLLADPKVLAMAGFVVLLLSALTWISMRRRRATADSPAPEEPPVEEAAAEEAVPEAAEAADHDYASTGGDLLEAEINEIDPLAEADVYMAYRRYQQAEDLLKSAIQQEPHRHELQLKLAEVFAAAGNTPAFIAEAENLYSELAGQGSPIWDKVVEMGREIQPDHPLFMEGGPAVAGDMTPGTPPEVELGPATPEDRVEQTAVAADDEPLVEEPTAEMDAPMEQDQPQGVESPQAQLPAEEPNELQDDSQDSHMIEFEPGAASQVETGPAAEQAESVGQGAAVHGNEIDFDLPSDTKVSTEEEPADDPLADLVGADVQGRQADPMGDDAPAVKAEDAGMAGVDHDSDDGLALTDAQLDSSASPDVGSGTASDATQARGHELDFDIDLDKISGREQDFDNLFEDLDGDDSSGTGQGEEGQEADSEQQDVGTRLDLAKAFMEMGDQEGAKEILREVVDLGDEGQKQEAQGLLQQLQV